MVDCKKSHSSDNIMFCAISGEASDDSIAKVPDLIRSYALYDIYNMEQTSLFFCALSEKSLIINVKVWTGGKLCKTRL